MKTQLHFINEDYDWMPDLLIEEDDMGPTLVDGYCFEKIVLSEDVIQKIPQEELHFFRIKGLDLSQI